MIPLPLVVAVQQGDTFRLFRTNGTGAVELGRITTGPIDAEAAVQLALGISTLIDAAHESHQSPAERKAVVGRMPVALPAGTSPAMAEVMALVAANPGLQSNELLPLSGIGVHALNKRLQTAGRDGLLVRRGRRYYAKGAAPPAKRGATEGHGRNASDLPDTDGFVAYIRTHPGLTRHELHVALGYTKRQTIHNRMLIANRRGAVTVDEEGRVWPTAEPD